MKFFAILAAAALAFAHASFSGEAVKVGGKYYVEDSEGNLIRIPGDSAAPSPRRRPARSGKYGLPHPSSWHSQPQAGQKAHAPAGAAVEGPESPRGEPPSAAEASAEYECSVVEIRGGKRTVLCRFRFSLPESAGVAGSGTVAEGGGTLVVFEISRLGN